MYETDMTPNQIGKCMILIEFSSHKMSIM